jgi:cytidine deaminase
MKSEVFKFDFKIYDSIDELNAPDALLLREARKVTRFAYAPYSSFRVGAFAKLVNGETISGTNQENASYPAGICAERTLISVASSLFPEIGIDTIAISYDNLNGKVIIRSVLAAFAVNRYQNFRKEQKIESVLF